MNTLRVVAARQHNLKSVDCSIPKNCLVAITGPSGSGKSSLAFDTIYAEGQRRYVESLSAKARLFLESLPRPNVERIEGLSPAIALEQKSLTTSPRSTVGTVTEISDHLRVALTRFGKVRCSVGGETIQAVTAQDIVDELSALPEGTRFVLLSPMGSDLPGELQEEFDALRKSGYLRARLDGEYVDLSDELVADGQRRHRLDVVIDRLTAKSNNQTRVADSVEHALMRGKGTLLIDFLGKAPAVTRSERLVCLEHGVELPTLEPKLFSFNSSHGACATCDGLGVATRIDPDRVIGAPQLSLDEGALPIIGAPGSNSREQVLGDLRRLGIDSTAPWAQLPKSQRDTVLYGEEPRAKRSRRPPFLGVLTQLEDALRDAPEDSDDDGWLTGLDLGSLSRETACPTCDGSRLRPETRWVSFGERTFVELHETPIEALTAVLRTAIATLGEWQRPLAETLLRPVFERIGFLCDVGLGYLTLDRGAATLSGGESQRVRLATQIGSTLSGVLYVLDEPSVGLHARDTESLLRALRGLVHRGNSVLMVEHDLELISSADYVLEMGPGAGEKGGTITAVGTVDELQRSEASLTGAYLTGRLTLPFAEPRNTGGNCIRVEGATLHNLKDVTVEFPVGAFTVVTGVSGSGKSSLVLDILGNAARDATQGRTPLGLFRAVRGLEQFQRTIQIDQAPIGRTPRSNPASYSGIFTSLRELYQGLPEARARGYSSTRFSFNAKGGRCEKCRGDGVLRVEMHLLPDAFAPCDSCGGRRYNRETLQIRYRGSNIADALDMTVDEASACFSAIPKIAKRLGVLRQLGLGYLRLGQPAPTLSGGEAQRLKLATELAKAGTGPTLYLLDEPTTGLHHHDVGALLHALFALCDEGNTVIAIEHHLDFAARADWIVDMGPEGGANGGRVVVFGSVEAITHCSDSHTGRFLRARATSLPLHS